MTSSPAYRSLIVGAGRIGAFYDSPGDRRTLTHCHAFMNHPKIELAGVVDADPARAAEAASRWQTTAYASLEEALRAAAPQIVSVCTPTSTHLDVVDQIARAKPPFVFLEKPIGARRGDAARIAARLAQARSACMVNFPRRFDPDVQQAAKAARVGTYGPFVTGAAYYAKGLRNNGSHLVNLIQLVLGPITDWQALDRKVDHLPEDASADLFLRLERGGTFHLIPVDERAYSITDVTFLFSGARVHFRNFGLEVCVSRRREDPVFPGYWDLEDQNRYTETGLGRSMDRAVEQIVAFLDAGAPFDSDLASAMETEVVIDEMSEGARREA